MITSHIQEASRYYALHPNFKEAFEFIATLNAETPTGVYEMTNGLKAFVSEGECTPTFKHGWEAHKTYIDIQYALVGTENIQWTPLKDSLTPSCEYSEEKDITFFTGKGEQTFVKIGEGIFAIFFPEDAHAPGLMVKSIPTQIKKVVVKVPV